MNPKANNSTNSRRLWGIFAAGCFVAALAGAQTFQIVHEFTAPDGTDPHTGIMQMKDGFFAGTTVGRMDGSPHPYGTLFRMDSLGRLHTIHAFDWRDGANPHGTLFQADGLPAADGVIFGTTMNGALGAGTAFKVNGQGAFATCKVFNPNVGGLNGEGGNPHAALMQASDGKLYGVTVRGGPHNIGTIYQMDGSCNLTTFHHFSGYDGALPYEALLEVDGVLYGTTSSGGTMDKGTVFRIDKNGPTPGFNFRVIHNFTGSDGSSPQAGLAEAYGFLYGTTREGGNDGLGTIFRVNPSGTNFAVVHHFVGPDGAHPYATLIKARDNHLYGTTFSGGLHGESHDIYGGIFRLHPLAGGFEVVHVFGGDDGAGPQSRLFQASDGALYGTTGEGGGENRGVVFRLVFVRVDSIWPTSGRASGVAIAINGANFLPGAAVRIGGIEPKTLFANDSLILATTPVLDPGTLNDVLVDNPDNTRGGVLRGFFADFLDVPQGDIFHAYVEKIFRHGITVGVGGGNYGRNFSATRAQMAVFLLKAIHGQFYVPPPATGMVFDDVPADNPFAPWIEQLRNEGITRGCNGGTLYCPYDPMTREQMAVVLLKAKYGYDYVPPACQGLFTDVPCTADYAPWIEQLYREGITAGCGGTLFCPGAPSTRGQTAVFLTKTFGLQ